MRMFLGWFDKKLFLRFRARHVRGDANTLTDGISRWPRYEFSHSFKVRSSRTVVGRGRT